MPTRVPNPGRLLRNIKRAREILMIFAGYGFKDIIQELELDRLVLSGRRLIGLSEPDEEIRRQPQAVRLRRAMERLGPTFVKMGQVLSTRPDLIPEDWAKEFAKLQSSAPPVPEEEIREHIEKLYGGQVEKHFKTISYQAEAAASIAQAHRATLHDGTEVILKVLRPKVELTIEADIEILRTLASFAESHFENLGYSPSDVVEQFEHQIRREIDMHLEMRSIRRMGREFSDDDRLRFPEAYPEHSNEEIACIERIDGVLLSNRDDWDFTEEERREIVAIGSDAVFRQCFEIGFFHADPHPGNIFVLREQGRIKLCFIDYGMTGHIDPHTADLLADLVHGTINGDLERVVDVVIALSNASPITASDRSFRADTWEFISRFQTGSLSDLQMGALLDEFFSKIRRNNLRVPADIVYLIKAVTTIEGVGESISPEFDIVNHVRPHIERLINRRYGLGAIRRRIEGSVLGYAELLERLPRELRDLLHIVRHEQVTMNLEHRGLDQVTNELERASRNISYALVISALIVGGAILLLADTAAGQQGGVLFYAGVLAIVLAGVLAVVRILLATKP